MTTSDILHDRRHRAAQDGLRPALTATLAILFGAFLIYGAGFAHPEALHNAAHDSRHAFAFPCH